MNGLQEMVSQSKFTLFPKSLSTLMFPAQTLRPIVWYFLLETRPLSPSAPQALSPSGRLQGSGEELVPEFQASGEYTGH